MRRAARSPSSRPGRSSTIVAVVAVAPAWAWWSGALGRTIDGARLLGSPERGDAGRSCCASRRSASGRSRVAALAGAASRCCSTRSSPAACIGALGASPRVPAPAAGARPLRRGRRAAATGRCCACALIVWPIAGDRSSACRPPSSPPGRSPPRRRRWRSPSAAPWPSSAGRWARRCSSIWRGSTSSAPESRRAGAARGWRPRPRGRHGCRVAGPGARVRRRVRRWRWRRCSRCAAGCPARPGRRSSLGLVVQQAYALGPHLAARRAGSRAAGAGRGRRRRAPPHVAAAAADGRGVSRGCRGAAGDARSRAGRSRRRRAGRRRAARRRRSRAGGPRGAARRR